MKDDPDYWTEERVAAFLVRLRANEVVPDEETPPWYRGRPVRERWPSNYDLSAWNK